MRCPSQSEPDVDACGLLHTEPQAVREMFPLDLNKRKQMFRSLLPGEPEQQGWLKFTCACALWDPVAALQRRMHPARTCKPAFAPTTPTVTSGDSVSIFPFFMFLQYSAANRSFRMHCMSWLTSYVYCQFLVLHNPVFPSTDLCPQIQVPLPIKTVKVLPLTQLDFQHFSPTSVFVFSSLKPSNFSAYNQHKEGMRKFSFQLNQDNC